MCVWSWYIFTLHIKNAELLKTALSSSLRQTGQKDTFCSAHFSPTVVSRAMQGGVSYCPTCLNKDKLYSNHVNLMKTFVSSKTLTTPPCVGACAIQHTCGIITLISVLFFFFDRDQIGTLINKTQRPNESKF